MNVLFGLLLLFLSSVHGRMIRCFVGGIVKNHINNEFMTELQEQYCDTLFKESFLQKSYINLFGILFAYIRDDWNQILNMEIDTYNVDLPIMITKDNTKEFYTAMTMNAGLKLIQNSEEFHETYSMKLLHMDKSIEEYWDDIVKMGTDMHRLKFHSKLISLYNMEHSFTTKEFVVFLQSSYSVIGIFNLTNNALIAGSLVEDIKCIIYWFWRGMSDASMIDKLELATWELLNIKVYNDTISHENMNDGDREFMTSMLNVAHGKIDEYSVDRNTYPCSYLFMFGRILLDQKTDSNNKEWIKYATLLKEDKIINCDSHPDKNKIEMYVNILLSIYDPDFEIVKGITSFGRLLTALKIPVFTSEDRLINYKVTTMAMNKISDCVSINSRNVVWVEYENSCLCNTLQAYRTNDKDLDNILTKLTYMQVYQMTDDYSDFVPEYRNEKKKIDENKLHMIVTMGLDNMANDFILSSKRINIIKTTINRLQKYVNTLEAPQAVENVMTLGTEKINDYYREKMQAYKWLAELHGVLCTNSNNQSSIEEHQEGLEKSLTMAIMLQRGLNFNDDHLEFLFYKKICKDSQLSYSWESNNKADGWIQKSTNSEGSNSRSIFLQGNNCFEVSKFLGTDNRFIHQADVNILIFKYLMKEHYADDSISTFVKNALTHVVVSSEDRVRNLQAHDLYSMYFVWRNYRIAKEEENN